MTLDVIGVPVWNESLDEAIATAVRNDKLVMVLFTRSDWSPPCARFMVETFDTPYFRGFASEYLTFLRVDFPRAKPLSIKQQRANSALAAKFRVTAYPTLIFLSQEGRELHRCGDRTEELKPYMDSLVKALGIVPKPRKGVIQDPRITRPKGIVPENPPPPLFGGAAAGAPPRYTNFVLKSISGTPDRRFALLNNQTLGAGETASVMFDGGNVKVRCVEIRERSMVVQVEGEGESREIQLPAPK